MTTRNRILDRDMASSVKVITTPPSSDKIPMARCPLCGQIMEVNEDLGDIVPDEYRTIRYCCFHPEGVVDYAIVYRFYTNEELGLND